MYKPETVVAVYNNYATAKNAFDDLMASGFTHEDVGLAANDARGEYAHVVATHDVTGAEGAGFGATVGGVTGAVAVLAALVIPGVGPIIAAGPLVALLGGATGAVVGAVTGAVTGGLAASLIHIGVPEEEADIYAESVRRGGALVTVTVHNDAQATNATNILRRYHPVDLDHRVDEWREKGWSKFDPNAQPYSDTDYERERTAYPTDTPVDDDDTATIRRYPPMS